VATKIPVDKFTNRNDYSKLHQDDAMPNLLAVQLESYNDFLQTGKPVDSRLETGLEGVFQAIFPISSTRGHLTMEYQSYTLGEPKYGIEECQERGLTFALERFATEGDSPVRIPMFGEEVSRVVRVGILA
jgi:DNA-directed RNA polymerase beta subunit